MVRHATSHGLATLVCTLSSGMLVHMGRQFYPGLYGTVEKFCRNFLHVMKIDFSSTTLVTLIIALLLAMIWGVAFSFMHSDR